MGIARVSRETGRTEAAALFAAKLRQVRDSGEGHMSSGIRVFVVLSWVAFALRQILLKPVKVLTGRDFRSR
ncbi:MAG: hypothetical protein DMG31_17160 [Acidobacteria bacterium]|nr:MAG: hypothetical protein DMG31_17160 [Acidobacteriota bacterium]